MSSLEVTTVDVLDSITVNNSVNATSVSATTLSGNGASITSVTPADGTVTEAKLSNGAVTASKTASTIAKYADTTADFTGDLQTNGISVGYKNIPISGSSKTTSYQLTTADKSKHIMIGSGGSITVPDATFSDGDVVVLVNDTTGDVTITLSTTTAYIAGDNTAKAGNTATLATRGLANIFFANSTYCIVSGNIS